VVISVHFNLIISLMIVSLFIAFFHRFF